MNKLQFRCSMLMAISLLAMTSCGNQNQTKRDHLIFYVWGDSAEIACYEKIAADYNAKIESEAAEGEEVVKVKVQAATGDYYDNLSISFSTASTAPDIFFTESGEFLSHLASKKIMNLSSYIESGKLDIKSGSNADGEIELWSVNDAYKYDGNEVGKGDYYALIKDWSPDFVMWYNKAHIDEYNTKNNLKSGDDGFMEYPSSEVPMTWDEFLDMSYKLTIKDGSTVRYGTMLDRVPYKHLMEWIQMTGSSTWDSEYKKFNNTDPNVYKAFEFFVNLQLGDKASSPVVGPTGIGSGEAFANGNISFAFFGNWAYSTYNWDSVGFEIGYCPAPVPAKSDGSALTSADVYAGSSGMISLAVHDKTTRPDEAIDFLNYYMTKGNEYMATKGFNIPGNKIVANSNTFKNPEDSSLAAINQYFLNIANNYTHPLVYNKYVGQGTFEDIVGKYMSDYLSNPTGSTLQQVLDNIAADVEREL